MYLLEGYKGTEKIMGVILSAAYIVAKGSDILQRVKFLKRSFIKFLQKTVSCCSCEHGTIGELLYEHYWTLLLEQLE